MFQRMALAVAFILGSVAATFADCDCCGGKCGTKTAMKSDGTFGVIETPTADVVKAKAEKWLKSVKNDAQTMQQFEKIWQNDSPVLDRLAKTFVLGDPAAAKLMTDAVNPGTAAPMAVPETIKNAKDSFFRANLGLAYAKALVGRRVHEEALSTLQSIKPEETVEPASYYFHKAVAEHALLKRDDAAKSILCVLDNVPDAPERYRLVGTLMLLDMTNWKDKDLGWINRKMGNIERRLDLARGGPETQKMQREVLHRLDEMIKELEKQKEGGGGGGGGGCPGGGCPGTKPGGGEPNAPMPDSQIANNGGPGNVDEKKLKELYKEWGKLPEKDKAEAISSRIRDLPPHLREVAKEYFDRMSRGESK